MSIAENIKRAALGRTPRTHPGPAHLAAWDVPWHAVREYCDDSERNGLLRNLTHSERRMFLLFVAYSLGAK